MSIEPNDPRLTAYALGELEGEELEAFEAELAKNQELSAEVDAIKETAALLANELQKPSALALADAQREEIERALASRPKAAPPAAPIPIRSRRRSWIFAVAAALPIVLAFGAFTFGVKRSADRAEVAAVGKQRALNHDESKAIDMPAPAASAAATATAPMLLGDGKERDNRPFNTESYDHVEENPFVRVANDPRSTFSIDVDTASYSLVRRHLDQGQLPPKGAVRIEELLNYFSYEYPEPKPGELFTVSTEVSEAPWAAGHRLVRIGLKGKAIEAKNRPPANLVFLLDVSGSMNEPNKLPLLKRSLSMLVNQLDTRDHVSIVVYAGSSGLVLPPTAGNDRGSILGALDRLEAGGSTNGGEGIRLAYATAAKNMVPGGVNRVILATDGDFNVGVTNQSDLVELVQERAKGGVNLSVLGFGMGNYKDSTLEKLADKGNGNYAYIDTINEAKKVLVEQAMGTLITIAKDVKIQLELNPREVEAFRLIGYENRLLAHQDFNDDKKDAGDIGAGHTVTALYELVPAGGKVPGANVDDLKYQEKPAPSRQAGSGELMTVKLRYKLPDGEQSKLLEVVVRDSKTPIAQASNDLRFAAGVASFGMLLRGSQHKGTATYQSAIELANAGLNPDARDLASRREMVSLMKKAETLTGR